MRLSNEGLGIVDCGATASLASIDAMEAIMKVNLEKCGRDRVTVLPENRPTFKFGNGQRKETRVHCPAPG